MKDDVKARLLATFRAEADEHIRAITAHLTALERGLFSPTETGAALEATFREVHTLKGAARSVSLKDIEAVCQAIESVLGRVTRGQLPFSRALLNRLQEAVDGAARLLAGSETHERPHAVQDIVCDLERAAAARDSETPGSAQLQIPRAELPAAPVAAALPATDTVRVATARLDALLLQAEDLLLFKLAAAERVRRTRALVEALARWQTTANGERPAGHTNGGGRQAETRALEAHARETLTHLRADERTITATVDGLLDELRRLRMTPASSILDVFPRMVRELAKERDKDVEWTAEGAHLEIDRRVLESMKDPLIHLVRNAVDHGIEPPHSRVQAGKAPRGRVAMTIASLEGNRIEIRVDDDGRGIDVAQVRAAAVRTHLLSEEEARGLGEYEALDLTYRSGLSTSPIITEVSGHGLGLAIVKERVSQLGGEIRLETKVGSGTTVRMILPASIATFRGLLVESGGQPFLLPTEAVERTIRVAADTIESVQGHEAIRWNEYPLSVSRLSGLLGFAPEGPPAVDGKQLCVVVRSGEERLGLLVDEILGSREVLVKDLRPPLVRVKNVASAGLLGTGQVVLILRPTDLLKTARESRRPTVAVGVREKREPLRTVLVVDDSITTRTMEKNLLQAAGYQVRAAVDGIDAWTVLKSETIDLVVSDVDMPRMNGFELTSRIRADQKLGELPIVLVTALESRDDKERGIEVGANAYVLKSSFDQSNLLEIIHRLV